MASIIAVPNETTSQTSRVSKSGKRVTYRLNVIQQPERARACGSGAKSSADRRPVDPPPIVELRIFEGEDNNLTDVTFSYNANYFLFATLENARTIAQGRVQPAAPSFPVLTGTPVAGMAYLDRPTPAGYFIFPDLSVRHEGKYRLSFALYEELKNQGDMDADDNQTVEVLQQAGYQAHVSHRLEVKSAPFTVFSAKKFPGLTESTSLSRMVAEQGCRVRIRRDVRMRRRDKSDNKDWDDYEDDTAAERARRTATPADSNYGQPPMPPAPVYDSISRPRSASNASVHSHHDTSRRTSQQDAPTNYSHPYPPQHGTPQPQSGYSAPGQYPNGPPPSYPNHYPQQPQAIMQPPHQQSHFPAPPPPPQHHSYQAPPAPAPAPAQAPQGYGYPPPQSYSQPPAPYEQSQPQSTHSRHESMEYTPTSEYIRPRPTSGSSHSSAGSGPPPSQSSPYSSNPPPMNHYSSPDAYSRPLPHPTPSHHQPPPAHGHALAPLKTLTYPAEKIEPASPSYPPGTATSSPGESHGHTLPAYQPAGKRTFSSTFDTRHIDGPLRQGARPNASPTAEQLTAYDEDSDDQEFINAASMRYRRADGTHRSRRIPTIGD